MNKKKRNHFQELTKGKMGCTNSKLETEIVQIKKEACQQAIEQNTLQVEFIYLMGELKIIKQQLEELQVFKEQFQDL